MNVEQRQEIERKVVRHLIRTMKKHGWIITRIDDGGDPDEDTIDPNEEQAMDAVFAVDAAAIYFHKAFGEKRGATHHVQIILGNDGYDAIADNSCSKLHPMDDFAVVMETEVQPYCDKQEEECS